MPYIRPVQTKDLLSVLEMIHQLAGHHGDTPIVTVDDLARDTAGPTPWLTVLVAEKSGQLVGYAALCPLVQLQFGLRGMDMYHLFVRAEMRGHGVGRQLIEESLRAATALGCRYVTVGTHPDNDAARDVYLASGFEEISNGPRFRIRLPV